MREGVGVEALLPGPQSVALKLGTGEELTARQVVLAPGPWLGAPAWRDLVAPLGVRVKKVVAAAHRAPPGARRPGDRAR